MSPVNDVIAVLAGDGEDVKAAGAGARETYRLQRAAEGCRSARRAEARGGTCTCDAVGEGRSTGARQLRHPRHKRPAPQTNGHGRIFSSPLARRLAKDAGIELARITGSGPHGRVIARDVEEAKSGKGLKAPAAAPAGAPALRPRCRTSRSARCSKTAATR